MKDWGTSVRDEKLFPLVQIDDGRNPFRAPEQSLSV